jgi:hypothetical protein
LIPSLAPKARRFFFWRSDLATWRACTNQQNHQTANKTTKPPNHQTWNHQPPQNPPNHQTGKMSKLSKSMGWGHMGHICLNFAFLNKKTKINNKRIFAFLIKKTKN